MTKAKPQEGMANFNLVILFLGSRHSLLLWKIVPSCEVAAWNLSTMGPSLTPSPLACL